jgi:hypothetical protein
MSPPAGDLAADDCSGGLFTLPISGLRARTSRMAIAIATDAMSKAASAIILG